LRARCLYRAVPVVVCLCGGLRGGDAGAQYQFKTDGQWRGLGGASLSVTSGNTRSTALLLNLDLNRATENHKITLAGTTNYARSNVGGVTQTTAEKWSANSQYDRNLTPEVFTFGKLGFDSDRLIRLRLRSSLTVGAGYHFVNTRESIVDAFAGAGYISDKYSSPQTIDGVTDEVFVRATLLFGEQSSHQLSPTTSAKQRLEIYPGINGDRAVLVKFNANVGVAITSALSLTVGLVDTYNNKPPPGLRKNDVGLFTGISVKLGAL
jgi:putative salt-induced outer membrane protein